jgi:uncharacterized protein (TIGR00251 family)
VSGADASRRPAGSLLEVRVVPRGGRDAVVGWEGDALRVRVSAPAAEGRANAAVLRLLALHFEVPRSEIEIVRGASSREKWIRVDGLAPRALRARDDGR